MLKFLKYINSFPFPFTVRHYAQLGPAGKHLKDGVLRSKESWQILRDEHPRYRIPADRETWLSELSLKKDGQDSELGARVNEFVLLLEKENIKTVYSVGSGGGVFEYFLKKRLPRIRIIASEPTQEGVNRLKKVFIECDTIEFFDALDSEGWERVGSMEDAIVFIYRNEREFTDNEWRKMFRDMRAAGVKKVFLGLMNMLTMLAFVQEKLRNISLYFHGTPATFVGYLRNHAAFRSFWKGIYKEHEVYFPNCRGLYLTKI